jgi:hypothetical protein
MEPDMTMNSSDAIRLMVRHYPGGTAAVALFLAKSPNTLEKELRGESTHKLGLVDACIISSRCIELGTQHCRAYVNAVAAECGGFVQLQVRDDMPRQDLRVDLAMMLKEASDTISVITAALADDRLSDNERRAAEREIGEMLESIQRVQQGIRSVHAASKPKAVRSAA